MLLLLKAWLSLHPTTPLLWLQAAFLGYYKSCPTVKLEVSRLIQLVRAAACAARLEGLVCVCSLESVNTTSNGPPGQH